MKNSDILSRAILKARENGWVAPPNLKFTAADEFDIYNLEHIGENKWYSFKIRELLLNHDFAKALWGEEHDCGAGYNKKREIMRVPNLSGEGYAEHELNLDYVTYCLHHEKSWQYHLQQMVTAEDPIKYLGDNL